jgi:hypothetical protein
MMGLAFGLDPNELGLQRQIVSANEALAVASQRSQAAVGAVATASR